MTQGIAPNDIFHNGVWYNRDGGGGVVTAESNPLTGGSSFYYTVYAGISPSKSAADNKLAIQVAIDEAYAAGGGRVVLPPFAVNIDGGIELRGGVDVVGYAPRLDFFQNCPDLLHTQNSGTRFIGSGIGSGALFVGRTTPNLTGPEGGPVPTFPDTTSDGLGMMTIGGFGVSNFDIGIQTGAKNTNGMAFSKIENIHFEDMHEWCLKITNPQHVSIDRIYGYSVKRGIWLQGDNSYCAPGISYIERSFIYLDYVGAGQDYAQRYAVYISCDSELVTQPFQMDGIRINKCQFNMYSGVSVSDSIHIYAKGADSSRNVNMIQISDTYTDGSATHAIKLENAYNCKIDMGHVPSTIYGGSTIELINARRAFIVSQNDNVIINADAGSTSFFVQGVINQYKAGSRLGLGLHYCSNGNMVMLGTRNSQSSLMFDQTTFGVGPLTYDPTNPGSAKSTWANIVTMGSHSDQPGTSVAMSVDRTGVWKATNATTATWTLPTSSLTRGMEYLIVKKSGAGTVTIDAGSGKTIGFAGQTYALSATAGASVHLVYDDLSNNWHIAGKN